MATQPVAAPPAGSLADRVRGSLWGLLIADALSMPVHWYYDTAALRRDFGEITDFQAPKARHPSSIMHLSNTGGHGRGDNSGTIIGDVILHGKRKFWGPPGIHYHQGMRAGDNTLNALCARVVMRSIASVGRYDSDACLNDYVTFMTTPGSHNDTYAESFHRDFFRNYAAGVPPERCSQGTEGHNTAQIGGFVMLPPVVMAAVAAAARTPGASPDAVAAAAGKQALSHLRTTHESARLAAVAERYAQLLARVAQGAPLKELVASEGRQYEFPRVLGSAWPDVQVIHGVWGSACYIQDSWPSMLYLAWKYSDSFERAVLANTNVGGENCHRGAALGALMGAASGESGIPRRFIEGLAEHDAIRAEIDAFVAAVLPE